MTREYPDAGAATNALCVPAAGKGETSPGFAALVTGWADRTKALPAAGVEIRTSSPEAGEAFFGIVDHGFRGSRM